MTGDDGSGGVLYAYLSPMITVNNSIFNNNTATEGRMGGAAYADSCSMITIDSYCSTFNSNSADALGGAVYVSSSPIYLYRK